MKKVLCSLGVIGVLVALTFAALPAGAHTPGLLMSGRGTATVDGALGAGEWNGAAAFPFTVNLFDGTTTSAALLVMNDSSNLYLGLRMNRPSLDVMSSVRFAFDNNHNGAADSREDALLLTSNLGAPAALFDDVAVAGTGVVQDSTMGGASHGQGRVGNNGSFSFYEIAHPLNSGDVNDFSLGVGNTVGFGISVQVCDATRCAITSVPSNPGSFPEFGDIVILAPAAPTAIPTAVVVPASSITGVSTVATTPADKDDCKDGGWRALGFRNQGQCVSSVVSHRDDHEVDDEDDDDHEDNRGRRNRHRDDD